MKVPNCHGRRRQRWRVPLARILVLAFVFGSCAQAAEFDEKLKAPMMRGQPELRAQADVYTEKFNSMRESAPEQLIRDAAFAREKFDTTWKIQRAIDERLPLGEFAPAGITAQSDGSYRVDTTSHPEWNDLNRIITVLLAPANLDHWIPLLVARGFRPQDVELLRHYVQGHDAEAASAAATLPVALSFARTVRRYDKARRPVPDALVHSFWYQRARAANESKRLWVEGLMNLLEAQPRRILVSSFLELEQTVTWKPEDVSRGIAELLAEVRQPDFEARIVAEAKGVAP